MVYILEIKYSYEIVWINFEFQDVNEIAFDDKNLIVTTPAFMYEGKFHEVYSGIGNMIKKIVELIK